MAEGRPSHAGGPPGSAASASAKPGSRPDFVPDADQENPPRAAPPAPRAGPGGRSATRRSTPKDGPPGPASAAVPPRPSTAPPFASPAPPWRRTAGGKRGRTPHPDGATWRGVARVAVPIAEQKAMDHRGARRAQKEVTPAPATSVGCPPGIRSSPWSTLTPGKSTGLSTAGPTRTPARPSSGCLLVGTRSLPRTTRWPVLWGGRDVRFRVGVRATRVEDPGIEGGCRLPPPGRVQQFPEIFHVHHIRPRILFRS